MNPPRLNDRSLLWRTLRCLEPGKNRRMVGRWRGSVSS